jgi:tetratricopeptide (TPR) repeat protein
VASDLAEQAILRAAGYADRLPEREAVLVRAQVALHEGTLAGIEPLRQAVRRYPDDAETWEVLGDSYEHLGPEAMIDWQEAEAALGKAVELDSSFAPAYIHLTEGAFAFRADSARAARLVEAYGRLAGGTPIDVSNRVALALAFGDPAGRQAARTSLDTLSSRPLGYVARTFLAHPRFLDLQAQTLDVADKRAEAGSNVGRLLYFNNRERGRPREAVALLDRPDIPPLFKVLALGELHVLGYPVPPERLDRGLELPASDSASYGATFLAGAYAADRGRWSDHQAALERIRDAAKRASAAGDSLAARRLDGTAQALDGLGVWKRGGKAEATAMLESAVAQVTGYGAPGAMNLDIRWWLCELYTQTGRPRDAERCLRSFYPSSFALYRLAKIYEELGDHARARESYELFAIAWKDADPELQPKVEEARAAVQRLTSAIKE